MQLRNTGIFVLIAVCTVAHPSKAAHPQPENAWRMTQIELDIHMIALAEDASKFARSLEAPKHEKFRTEQRKFLQRLNNESTTETFTHGALYREAVQVLAATMFSKYDLVYHKSDKERVRKTYLLSDYILHSIASLEPHQLEQGQLSSHKQLSDIQHWRCESTAVRQAPANEQQIFCDKLKGCITGGTLYRYPALLYTLANIHDCVYDNIPKQSVAVPWYSDPNNEALYQYSTLSHDPSTMSYANMPLKSAAALR